MLDPATALWRLVSGADILDGLTGWQLTEHVTHQDPGAMSCMQRFSDATDLNDCYRRLGVADRRGFCVPANACPEIANPCDAMN